MNSRKIHGGPELAAKAKAAPDNKTLSNGEGSKRPDVRVIKERSGAVITTLTRPNTALAEASSERTEAGGAFRSSSGRGHQLFGQVQPLEKASSMRWPRCMCEWPRSESQANATFRARWHDVSLA